jgi:hypothetical protein
MREHHVGLQGEAGHEAGRCTCKVLVPQWKDNTLQYVEPQAGGSPSVGEEQENRKGSGEELGNG